jgi:hypothetical protein
MTGGSGRLSSARDAVRRLPDRVSPEKASRLILSGVDTAVGKRWDHARSVAGSLTGTTEERVARAARIYQREMAALGAAAGATAAVPGVGAVAAIGTAGAELGLFAARSADLVLVVAAVHGHSEATLEQRKAWILTVLAFGDTAAVGFTEVAGGLGKTLGRKSVGRIPASKLIAINRVLGRMVVTRYGARRGVVALGRVIPFGIGAVVGGTANYGFARAIAAQADRLFRDLPAPLDGRPG